MKKLLISAFFFGAAIYLHAQKIVVTKSTVDVGKTGYEVPVTAIFELKNKSSKTLYINEVKTDCGCTTVDVPSKAIAPNHSFTITMTYDAKMLGHFTKQVGIYSNATKEPVYLTMKGMVLEEWKDYSKLYPYDFEGILADMNDLEFDDVKKGDHPEIVFKILNNTNTSITPNLLHLPPYLTAIASPEILTPGKSGKLTVTLNSEKVSNYGLTQEPIYLAKHLGDTINNNILLPVSVVLLPDVKNYGNISNTFAPQLKMSAEALDLGMHKGRNIKNATMTITNAGNMKLSISSLQLFTSGLQVTLNKRDLQPGEVAKLKVKADRQQLLKARSKPRILMITNDPKHTKVVIPINVK